jgi:hypothetical protein
MFRRRRRGVAPVLAGLMRVSRFRGASLSVPGTALIAAILLVLIVMVATWPLLKFATMRPTDRIPSRSAVYLFLSTLGTIVLVCALAIHLRYGVNLDRVDANLRDRRPASTAISIAS